jgi:mRNA-degrading endonuclease toxin of MazEF toxin-antitoxin module
VPQEIQRGTVILAVIGDPSGKNPKDRPAIVLDRQEDIDAGRDLFVAVITTDLLDPLRSGWFDVPTKPDGTGPTGLREACIVKANWLDLIPQAKVLRVTGRAPARLVRQVTNWLADQARGKP